MLICPKGKYNNDFLHERQSHLHIVPFQKRKRLLRYTGRKPIIHQIWLSDTAVSCILNSLSKHLFPVYPLSFASPNYFSKHSLFPNLNSCSEIYSRLQAFGYLFNVNWIAVHRNTISVEIMFIFLFLQPAVSKIFYDVTPCSKQQHEVQFIYNPVQFYK